MPSPDRFLKDQYVAGFAAPDTIDHIATRVQELLRHGRRITTVSRYTYDTDRAPNIATGLTVDTQNDEPLGGAFRLWNRRGGNTGFGVSLRPGLTAGFSVGSSTDEDE